MAELDLTEAIEAAAGLIWHESNPCYPIRDCDAWDECKRLAGEILAAVTPLIERQVRERAAQQLRDRQPRCAATSTWPPATSHPR